MDNSNTHLSMSDLAIANAHNLFVISLKIKHSKADQGRRGVTVVIRKTGDDICPVSALFSYLVSRGTKLRAHSLWTDGSHLQKLKFVEEVRSALTKAAKDYVGHSFRIEAEPQQQQQEYRTLQFRSLADGKLILSALHQHSTSMTS